MKPRIAYSKAAALSSMALLSVVLVLAACSGPRGTQTVPAGAPALAQRGGSSSKMVRSANVTESVLYSFAGGSDGADPYSTPRYMLGALYGTTFNGGTSNNGTVFRVTTSGSETVVHTFGGDPDGANPYATETSSGYGVTETGGTYREGAFYHISKPGTEKVLYSFGNGSDGEFPDGSLIEVAGTFYGTTYGGGAHGDGTVFSLTSSGTETVLYSFAGGTDGANPVAGLTSVNGTLYGTTVNGGVSNDGTVFSVTTSGAEAVLYSFKSGLDGANPQSGLTNVGGALYGTTVGGGYPVDRGTVFKVTRTGKETVLHSFFGQPDGSLPEFGNLLLFHNVLYGTTQYGGTLDEGAAYSITPGGAEAVLYSFGVSGPNDGHFPYAGLTNVGGVFYGTTVVGGANGNGAVFALTP